MEGTYWGGLHLEHRPILLVEGFGTGLGFVSDGIIGLV
jgi:hypothetical protein